MADDDPVALDVSSEGVAYLTLTRVEAANARNQAMREALLDAYATIANHKDVNCLVLTGEGDRHFCAGMDLKEANRAESIMTSRDRLGSARDIEELARLPVPTIAAINGYALGAGCEMALACDLRYMALEAEIGLPELSHGLVPAGGGTRRLPQLVGPTKAAEMVYLSTRLGGAEAEAFGLVNRAVPRTELAEVVAGVAAKLASLNRHALAAAKRLLKLRESDGAAETELDALLMLIADQKPAP